MAVGLQLCILDIVKRKEGRAIRTMMMMIGHGENVFHSMNILLCARRCPRRWWWSSRTRCALRRSSRTVRPCCAWFATCAGSRGVSTCRTGCAWRCARCWYWSFTTSWALRRSSTTRVCPCCAWFAHWSGRRGVSTFGTGCAWRCTSWRWRSDRTDRTCGRSGRTRVRPCCTWCAHWSGRRGVSTFRTGCAWWCASWRWRSDRTDRACRRSSRTVRPCCTWCACRRSSTTRVRPCRAWCAHWSGRSRVSTFRTGCAWRCSTWRWRSDRTDCAFCCSIWRWYWSDRTALTAVVGVIWVSARRAFFAERHSIVIICWSIRTCFAIMYHRRITEWPLPTVDAILKHDAQILPWLTGSASRPFGEYVRYHFFWTLLAWRCSSCIREIIVITLLAGRTPSFAGVGPFRTGCARQIPRWWWRSNRTRSTYAILGIVPTIAYR